MRDPHVQALNYRLVSVEGVEFQEPPPVERETEQFRLRLENGKARFEMKEHYAAEGGARACVDAFLQAWEISAALSQSGRNQIHFDFTGSEIIDRDPPPPGGPQTLFAEGILSMSGSLTAKVMTVSPRYPEPPQAFVASVDVETMWYRYVAYKQGREPLGSMAYACYTLLLASIGGRRRERPEKMVERYGLADDVRRRFLYFVTTVGDRTTLRKFTTKEPRPRTAAEVSWVETVILLLIRRAGEWAANPNAHFQKVTMADLPKIDH